MNIDQSDKLVQDCLSKNAHKDQSYYHESYYIKKADQINEEYFIEGWNITKKLPKKDMWGNTIDWTMGNKAMD